MFIRVTLGNNLFIYCVSDILDLELSKIVQQNLSVFEFISFAFPNERHCERIGIGVFFHDEISIPL
jgi:hypothetical protein